MVPRGAVAEERLAQETEQEAFESFYQANRLRLFRALVVVTRDVDAAEEVAQESFVKVWERWERVARTDDPVG